MNFMKYGVSKNVMPSAVAATKELNGITITCDGKGTYTISGTASEYAHIVFDIPEFTTPISIGKGGNGTLSFFNTFDSNKIQIAFYYNSTRVDDWVCAPLNRTNTVYSAIGNKTINKITVNISGGTSVQGTVSPMFTNDGQLPAEFEPHMIWYDIPHYIHNTSTDTLTTLPADIYANDTTATVDLKGNMEQSSGVSPTTPIQPQETGERTGNLFYKIISRTNIDSAGKIIKNGDFDMVVAKVAEGETYSVSGVSAVMGFFVNEPEVGSQSYNNSRESVVSPVTIPQGVNYVAYRVNARPNVAMFNTGSRALPYEPYGYKIPISSGGTTTPVYLGEVQTTRMVKKWVLTGKETSWNKGNYPPTGGYQFFVQKPSDIADNPDWLTTHFKKGNSLNGSVFASYFSLFPETSILPENATINDFKAWLAAQYDAGTPVTIWYVLATPTTGIVNEPLRKIGDYADEVSGITIPTIAGANTIDIDTTLKPSEVSLAYTGWHDATVKEWDGSEWEGE